MPSDAVGKSAVSYRTPTTYLIVAIAHSSVDHSVSFFCTSETPVHYILDVLVDPAIGHKVMKTKTSLCNTEQERAVPCLWSRLPINKQGPPRHSWANGERVDPLSRNNKICFPVMY